MGCCPTNIFFEEIISFNNLQPLQVMSMREDIGYPEYIFNTTYLAEEYKNVSESWSESIDQYNHHLYNNNDYKIYTACNMLKISFKSA